MARMSVIDRYLFGFAPEQSVAGALSSVLGMLDPSTNVIVQCIDSESDLDAMTEILRRYEIASKICSNVLSVTLPSLRQGIDVGLFTGFDEVWLVGAPLRVDSAIPSSVYLTSDGTDFSREAPSQQLVACLDAIGCIAALGDGCGLNFITSISALADAIEK